MAKAVKTPKTNAMRELESAGISYVLHTYEDDGDESAGLGVAISEQLGEEPGQGFKTLVCVTPSNDHVVCCIPVADELDLKSAARAAGEKSLAMMHVKDLLAATGYVRGGCSPVGMKKRYRTLIDETCVLWDTIFISGGKRGYQLELAPDDLIAFCGATVAPITREDWAMPQEELKCGAHFAKESAPQTPSSEASSSRDGTDDMGSSDYSTVGRSAGLMTILTIVSRVTGFIRTWAMAAAIGMSLLSSSYQVANNLPNMLYELVMGGMLVTAFLPVYMGVRREQGREASNEYVGNLLGILLLLLGGISLLGTVFAPGFIWTQSFLSGDGGSMDTAAFMFRFFAIQILFYGLGSVFSGVLNAHRDYFWSTFAPVLNNVIVIASFMGFAPVSAQFGEQAGIILIAAGTTLGVFVQMACQIPALGKHGVHPHIHIDFKDPALRQTIALGIPTLLATVCMFVSTSITNAAALVVQPETGPSVIAYARLWYTLPYALIAASLSTALYTELSHDAQEKDYDSVRTGISRGVAQMLFFLIPFALYLIVFARPLNMIYCAGKFDESGVALVSEFLIYLALSLPLYGVVVLMQKSFSALLDMKPYSRYCLYSAIGQAGSVLLFGVVLGYGMPAIALSYVVDYVVLVGCSLWWLRRRLHGLQVKSILHGGFFGLLFGGLGAAAGASVMWALEHFFGVLGSSILITLGYVCVAGVVSLAVTFGLAFVFKMPEVSALLRRK